MMTIQKTAFSGLFLLRPRIFKDGRGYFFESYNLEHFFTKTGIKNGFVQDNEAKSDKGVIRGLHYQQSPFAQSKLVRVITGSVLDVVVDLRQNSNTFGQHLTFVLSGDNKDQLFIPKGFAHGYQVLENNTIFSYKCDAFYNPELEHGIRFDDEDLAIKWRSFESSPIVSEKDLALPTFKEHIAFL